MKKATSKKPKKDDLRSEYQLADRLADAVRGKYAAEYGRGTNLVLLDPDVAEAFADEAAVNEALRLALKLADLPRPKKATRSAQSAAS